MQNGSAVIKMRMCARLLTLMVWPLGFGFAIAQPPGVLSFNYVTTPLNIPCGPSTPSTRDWGPYITAKDNHEDRVQVRFKSGSFRYEQGSYQIAYQFRNGYSSRVHLEAEFQELSEKGPVSETVDFVLQPEGTSDISGAYSICRQMVSIQIRNIYVEGRHNPPPPMTGEDQPSAPTNWGQKQSNQNQLSFTVEHGPGQSNQAPEESSGSRSNCGGSDCLTILAVRTGMSCGSEASVDVDVRNDSNLYLRGYVIFDVPGGNEYRDTNLLKPGQKAHVYVCSGSSSVSRISNVGSDPIGLQYPKH